MKEEDPVGARASLPAWKIDRVGNIKLRTNVFKQQQIAIIASDSLPPETPLTVLSHHW